MRPVDYSPFSALMFGSWSWYGVVDMRRTLFALASVLLTHSVAAAASIGELTLPDPWRGGAYTSNSSGQFSHCAASAEYLSDVTLVIYVNSDFSWELGFVSDGWALETGRDHDVFLRFDRGAGEWLKASALADDHLVISMPGEESLIRQFRGGRTMYLEFAGRSYAFDLSGTSRVTALVAECVSRYANVSTPPSPAQVPASSPESSPPSSSGKTGTGVLVSEDGHILTNHHVVEQCAYVTVSRNGEIALEARVVKSDSVNDLAVLKVDREFPEIDVARFRVGLPMRAGEVVATYGYPLAGMLSSSGNISSGNVTALTGINDDTRMVQISAPVQPGNSGGPLIDGGGLVVGIVNARADDMAVIGATGTIPQNVNFSIRANIATNLLESAGVRYNVSPEEAPLSLVDIASTAQRFSFFVLCE